MRPVSDERDRRAARRRELGAAVWAGRGALVTVMIVSGFVNVLMLTAPIFMLQVYDRVLPSRSIATLVGLAGIALMLFLIQSVLEVFRARILARFGRLVEERLSGRLFRTLLARGVEMPRTDDGPQALRDLDTVRGFLASLAFTAFFDLPWVPLYVAVCFLFHPWLGTAISAGAVLLCLLTLVTDWATAASTREGVRVAGERRSFIDMAHRTAPLLSALGMRGRMAALWQDRASRNLDAAVAGNDLAIGFGAAARLTRTVLQSGVLGLGAYLVVREEASAGVMLAATVLSARALAPVDLAIANWKSFSAARQAWTRLVAFPAAPRAGRPHAPPCATGERSDHRPVRRRSRKRQSGAARRQCCPCAGERAGRDRPQRVRQIDLRPRSRRPRTAEPRRHPVRRSRHRPVGSRRPRPLRRVPAPGYRDV